MRLYKSSISTRTLRDVIVNGRPVGIYCDDGKVSYEQIVVVSGLKGSPTVTYRHRDAMGPVGTKSAGTLLPGRMVVVLDGFGTIFNVAHTGDA